ncbi:hypothetical protein HYPSUDRAFT_208692 [Hypholoma sublateritium FD-334 SS-4]|uniref:Uncharacterized protein n=1 Tax=Hypholoma sublateritium (strain FD-334 SS-4) TaxID=945553 RepID=A0A0D2LUD3_HYPSF|nr:hypothetical protein HYPSUDRAFT_208692 [Hypholoma sublateritium FD-334 SS-4]
MALQALAVSNAGVADGAAAGGAATIASSRPRRYLMCNGDAPTVASGPLLPSASARRLSPSCAGRLSLSAFLRARETRCGAARY